VFDGILEISSQTHESFERIYQKPTYLSKETYHVFDGILEISIQINE
jgi:hypothetical protein